MRRAKRLENVDQAVVNHRSDNEAVIGSVAAGPLAAGFAGLAGLACLAGLAVGPSLAVATMALGLTDLIPIAMASVLRSRQAFAMAWLAAALLRLPAAFIVSLMFVNETTVTDSLPFAYLASLLLSVAVTASILRAHEEAAAR